jgi:RNA polymerase sigma-70 factor (ECF subfamily)
LDGYYLAHAARADMLRRLGKSAESLEAYRRAYELSRLEPERRFLRRRIDEIMARENFVESLVDPAAARSTDC